MPKFLSSLLITAAIGLAASSGSASAAPVSIGPATPIIDAANSSLAKVHQVQRRWNRARHGNRCLYRGNHCRHFYRGYYYQTPWWTLPLVIGGTIAVDRNYGSRHVQWCLDRYRSYNPRTNTWISYGGNVRVCLSPYS